MFPRAKSWGGLEKKCGSSRALGSMEKPVPQQDAKDGKKVSSGKWCSVDKKDFVGFSKYSPLPIAPLASSGLRGGSLSSTPCVDGDLFRTGEDRCKSDCESCEDGGSLFVQRSGKEVVLEV